MYNYEDMRNIMENKNKLRDDKDEQIFINDDLLKKDRDLSKQIRKNKFHEMNNRKGVKIGYRQMYVDGQK